MTVTTHLFIPGPTNIPEAVRRRWTSAWKTCARRNSQIHTAAVRGRQEGLQDEQRPRFLFPSSGSGAWESAISNTLNRGDKVLMSRFGQFSLLWVDMVQRLGLKVQVLDEDSGTGVPVEKYAEILANDKSHQIKAVQDE